MEKKRNLIIVSCLLLLLIAGFETLAYLTHETGPVTNTFVLGQLIDDDAEFVLKEHKAYDGVECSVDVKKDGVYTLNQEEEVDANVYSAVLPGVDIPKDPFVQVQGEGDAAELQLDAYVFVEVVEKDFGTALSYAVDSTNWTELSGVKGPKQGKVYAYKAVVEAGSTFGPVYILEKDETSGKEIKVDNAEITDAAEQFGGSLEFYGYMIQAGGFADYNAAWAGYVQDNTPAADD